MSRSGSWITLNTTSGANNGSVGYALSANPSASSRTGTITVSGAGLTRTFTVEQSGASLPSLSTQPQDQAVTAPAGATFEASATGTTPLGYQWEQSTDGGTTWTEIAGATDDTYETGPTTVGMDGTRYRVVVSNTAGTATSEAAELTVSEPPDDHGDDPANATALSLGSSTTGSIGVPGDADVFRLEVVETGELTLWTEGGLDTFGTLLDGNGVEVGANDDGGTGRNFRIRESVSAGTYFVEVRAFSGAATGDYEVLTDFTATPPTGPSWARPEGWHWTEGEWEWSDEGQYWYWIPPGPPFVQNTVTGQALARPINGWNFYNWPYFYSASQGVWYYLFQGNLPYVLHPGTGQWRRWGE